MAGLRSPALIHVFAQFNIAVSAKDLQPPITSYRQGVGRVPTHADIARCLRKAQRQFPKILQAGILRIGIVDHMSMGGFAMSAPL